MAVIPGSTHGNARVDSPSLAVRTTPRGGHIRRFRGGDCHDRANPQSGSRKEKPGTSKRSKLKLVTEVVNLLTHSVKLVHSILDTMITF